MNPIAKRPCANCPFRADGAGIQLVEGRLQAIVQDLVSDDSRTFVCHKTLQGQRQTCAGAVGLLSKIGHLPIIARIALRTGHISKADIEASAKAVIDQVDLNLQMVDE